MSQRVRRIPVNPDGWKFILGFGLLGALFLFLGPWFATFVGGLLAALAVFSVFFFRDTERSIPPTADLVSPADGRVMEVADIDGEGFGPGRVIRIFLSVFDGHVQRAPVTGRIRQTQYRPGAFLDARDPRAPFANESNAVEIETLRGRVMVRQIAGLIARRILCWVRSDDTVEMGERIGLIRFGSQVDLYVTYDVEIMVKEGDRVRAGDSIVGRWLEIPGRPGWESGSAVSGSTPSEVRA
jgi:phosphatidylserine decarboxylase